MADETEKSDIGLRQQIVVLIHGIRTQAAWAEKVSSLLKIVPNIQVVPIRYGFFDSFRFIFPLRTRNAPIRRIARELADIRAEYPDADISVIAHSFGTYALVRALEVDPNIRLRRILFCGSIVRDDFRKADFRGQLSSDPILNDCGSNDIWPIVAQAITWGYGATGVFGFGTLGVRDRFNKFGHSDFFDADYITTYWLPFVMRGEIIENEYQKTRTAPPYWHSILARLPLRWVIPGILAFFVWHQITSFRWPDTEFIRVGDRITVGQYLGAPNVFLKVNFVNSRLNPQNIILQPITLEAPDGRVLPMRLEANVYDTPDELCVKKSLWPATQSWQSPLMGVSSYYFSFVVTNDQYNKQFIEVAEQLGTIQMKCRPDTAVNLLPNDITSSLKDFARNNWIWRPGRWTLTMGYQLNNVESKKLRWEFYLDRQSVECMKGLIGNYGSGIGIFAPWRLDLPDNTCGIIDIAFR